MIDQNTKESKVKSFFNEYRQEIKFVSIFLGGLITCFLIINNKYVANTYMIKITEAETWVAGKILNLLDYPTRQDGLYLAGLGENRFRMQVLNTCNGIYESVIFLMAFVAIQVPWRRKIGWMTIGFFFFHCVNEMRLVSLFIVGTEYPDSFKFFHETFWNYAVVIVALLTFIFCAYQVSKSSDAEQETKKEAPAT